HRRRAGDQRPPRRLPRLGAEASRGPGGAKASRRRDRPALPGPPLARREAGGVRGAPGRTVAILRARRPARARNGLEFRTFVRPFEIRGSARRGDVPSTSPLMKLSVVIPGYNERDTITSVIEKVASTPFDKEIIVVDDCSSDGTRDVLDGLDGARFGGV